MQVYTPHHISTPLLLTLFSSFSSRGLMKLPIKWSHDPLWKPVLCEGFGEIATQLVPQGNSENSSRWLSEPFLECLFAFMKIKNKRKDNPWDVELFWHVFVTESASLYMVTPFNLCAHDSHLFLFPLKEQIMNH